MPVWAAALGLAGLSWARALATGSPGLEVRFLPEPVAAAAAGAVVASLAAAWTGMMAVAASAVPHGTARHVTIGAVVLLALSAPMLPLLSEDVFSLLAYTDLAFATGVNPYTLPGPGLEASHFFPLVSLPWRDAPSVYGPLQLVLLAPAVLLGGASVQAALAVVKLIALLEAGALLWLLYWYVTGPALDRVSVSTFALVALNPVLWIEGAAQAHVDLLAGLLLAGWLLAGARGHPLAGAVLLGLAVSTRLTTLVPAGMYVLWLASRGHGLRARLGRAAPVAFVVAAIFAGTHAPFWTGPETILDPLHHLGHRAPTNTPGAAMLFVLTAIGADKAEATGWLNRVAQVALAALAAGGALSAWRATTLADLAARSAMVLALLVTLTTTVTHSWYLLPAIVLALEVRDAVFHRWLAVTSFLLVAANAASFLSRDGPTSPAYTAVTTIAIIAATMWRLPYRLRLALGGQDGVSGPSRARRARAFRPEGLRARLIRRSGASR